MPSTSGQPPAARGVAGQSLTQPRVRWRVQPRLRLSHRSPPGRIDRLFEAEERLRERRHSKERLLGFRGWRGFRVFALTAGHLYCLTPHLQDPRTQQMVRPLSLFVSLRGSARQEQPAFQRSGAYPRDRNNAGCRLPTVHSASRQALRVPNRNATSAEGVQAPDATGTRSTCKSSPVASM